ncbi:tetratricopeptide repeat-containing sensor histidine kinase [Macellibacteroides fermentans]|uniref:tetratricopeptide repeat-containing sensor histidine kinase n=1 Tax=Macellibacteroides fermentans TaxID=879969 RepID=UPI00406C2DA8
MLHTPTETKRWFDLAVEYEKNGKIEESIQTYRQALHHAEHENSLELKAQILNNLAILLSDSGLRQEGIELSFKAYEAYLLLADSARAANVKINIGTDYIDEGKFEEALKVMLEGLELRTQCGDSTNLAAYYLNIGDVYKQLNIDKKWKLFLEKARTLAATPKYATFDTRICILNELGSMYDNDNAYDQAIKVYQEMYNLSKKEGFINGMATALNNLASVYLEIKQNKKALLATQESLTLNKKDNNYYGLVFSNNLMGDVYLALGNTIEAKKHYKEGINLANKYDFKTEYVNSYEGLYKTYRKEGNWKEALFYNEQTHSLTDSLQNKELQEKVLEIEAKYQAEKKERQIELLHNENELKNARIKLQNVYIWGVSLLFILVSAGSVWIVRQKRIKQRAKQVELEQKLLRSQMNPHFLFNSLGAIQSYMLKNDGRKAAFYLSNLSSLMRAILKNSREEVISLQEEKETLEKYLVIHKLRLGERLNYVVSVSEELDLEEVYLPPMMIQPFVENAVIHGIEPMDKEGIIHVRFYKEETFLVIQVDDNGAGIHDSSKNKNATHVSYALQIFKERVANLKKRYGTEILYSIIAKDPSIESGTLVTVKIPLKSF